MTESYKSKTSNLSELKEVYNIVCNFNHISNAAACKWRKEGIFLVLLTCVFHYIVTLTEEIKTRYPVCFMGHVESRCWDVSAV